MIYRSIAYVLIAGLTLVIGCSNGPGSPNGNASESGAAAIVGKIAASSQSSRPFAALDDDCPEVNVSVNGAAVDIDFGDDCTFVITGVQPAALVQIRVELVALGVAGTLDLSDVLDGELIEILIDPTDDSLTLSIARRSAPQPSDDLPEVIQEDDVSILLSAGRFQQDLTVIGDRFTLVGEAGDNCADPDGWTVIEGEVLITGDDATFRNIMFEGQVELHGHGARFINSCFGDELVIFGSGSDDAPQITCPSDLTVECNGAGNDAELDAWLEDVDVDSACDDLDVSDNFDGLEPDCGETGHVTVTWTAGDDCGSDSCEAMFTIVDTTAPEVSGPGDLLFVCDESGDQTELADWLDSPAGDDTCSDVSITFDRDPADVDCQASVVWTAEDECGNTDTHSAQLTIEGDESDPVLTRNGAAEFLLECGVDAYVELGAAVTDTCDATIKVQIGGDEVDDHSPGTYVVTYDATDLCGHSAVQQIRTVIVEDTLAPTVTSRGRELWPANHDQQTLTLADCALVVDACEGELDANEVGIIVSIYSDEPEDSNGDGNTTSDIVIVDDHTFRVRAERQGGGNGRVYGVIFMVTDSAGNSSEERCSISVPHDQSGRDAEDDGPSAGYTVQN